MESIAIKGPVFKRLSAVPDFGIVKYNYNPSTLRVVSASLVIPVHMSLCSSPINWQSACPTEK
jgi:hypothetical protein